MEEFMMFTIYLEGLNALLSLGLLYIYTQNYRALKSSVGVGLMIFSLVLLLQNVVGLFLHFTTGDIYAEMAATEVFGLKLVESLALLVLSYTAWKN